MSITAGIFGKAAVRGLSGKRMFEKETILLSKAVGEELAKQGVDEVVMGGCLGPLHVVAKGFTKKVRGEGSKVNPVVAFLPLDNTGEPDAFKSQWLVSKKSLEKYGYIDKRLDRVPTELEIPAKLPEFVRKSPGMRGLVARVDKMLGYLGDRNSFCIVIHGGEGTKHEVLGALRMEIPVWFLEGSGGFAEREDHEDAVREVLGEMAKQVSVEDRADEIERLRTELVHYSDSPHSLVADALKLMSQL